MPTGGFGSGGGGGASLAFCLGPSPPAPAGGTKDVVIGRMIDGEEELKELIAKGGPPIKLLRWRKAPPAA